MTVIRPNSISGISSITAQGSTVEFYDPAGNKATVNSENLNIVGVITAAQLNVGTGITISAGVITATQLNVGTGITITAGVITATSFSGDGSGLSGIDATSLKDSGGNVKVQANTSGAVITGIVTSTSFSGDVTGDVTGNLTGNADSSTTATSAQGLTGTPNVVVGIVTATEIAGVSTIGVTTVTATTLTVNGNAFPSAGPLSNRNLIINGGMNVAQRGTSSTTNGYGSVDRFRTSWGGGTITQSQETLTSGSPYDEGFRYFARMTNTDVTTDVNNYRRWLYYVEAQDMAQSGWDYTNTNSFLTLSYWIRSSVSQEFYHYVDTKDGSQRKLFYWSTGTLAANTWTKITKTMPGHADIAFDNDNAQGFQIDFGAYLGMDTTSSSAGSAETWNDRVGSNRTPDFTQTWANTDEATFDITGVQLEVGSVRTPFEHRSYGDELARCQRYYIQGNDYHWFYDIQTSQTEASLRTHVNFPVTMRANPTVVGTIGYTAGNSSTTLTTQYSRPNGAAFYPTQSQTTGIVAFAGYTASAEL